MFGNQVEDQFLNTISRSGRMAGIRNQWPVLIFFAIGICALFIWAFIFEIEEVTTGIGRVIPSSQIQVVQTLEGGIVRSISAREGDIVEAGDVLLQIDDTGFSSKLGELREQKAALDTERIRLEAEAERQDSLYFPPELEKKNPQAILAEKQVFSSRRRQLGQELRVLEDRLAQRRAEKEELFATRRKLDNVITLLNKEVALTRDLYNRGVVPEVEYIRLQSRLVELEGDLGIGMASLPRMEASIREASNQIEASKNSYILTARERLAKLQVELAVVAETIRAASDRVTRTQLRAPARGIVNKINITTIGAVIQPGVDIIEIVPIDDGLLIEADIRPQDVAFIKTGEKASVKLTAYDYLVYGALDGIVSRISADTITDKQGEELFRIVVRTDRNFLGTDKKKLPIIPGMVASVDIQTGRKTVMTYLMKPFLRARAEAFRER